MAPDTIQKIIWIGIGSALGGNARFWIGTWIQQRWGVSFPIGTLFVNVTGSFILGLFISLFMVKLEFPHIDTLRLLFAIGFVGSYTTFSTFEYETFALVETGSLLLAFLNVLGSVTAGFIAVWLGIVLGRLI